MSSGLCVPPFPTQLSVMAAGNAHIGKPAPDFQATAVVEGAFKEVKLSDYRGEGGLEGAQVGAAPSDTRRWALTPLYSCPFHQGNMWFSFSTRWTSLLCALRRSSLSANMLRTSESWAARCWGSLWTRSSPTWLGISGDQQGGRVQPSLHL